jgi:hypothetical protein
MAMNAMMLCITAKKFIYRPSRVFRIVPVSLKLMGPLSHPPFLLEFDGL